MTPQSQDLSKLRDPYETKTDACNYHIVFALFHIQEDGSRQLIVFWSMNLHDSINQLIESVWLLYTQSKYVGFTYRDSASLYLPITHPTIHKEK